MIGTRDLAILTGRNREIPETEICKENQAVFLAHLINAGNSRTVS